MSMSARFEFPLLVPGQAQKEFVVNEALQSLEMLVQPVVEDLPMNSPPVDPAIGLMVLVGPEPVAEFEGHPHAIACRTNGGWRFRNPSEGLEILVRSTGLRARFSSGEWQFGVLNAASIRVNGNQVLSGRQPAIADAAGGAVVDEQARSALASILTALRQHGLIAEA